MPMKNPVWVVKDVEAREDYTLLLTFADGSKKIYDARPLLEFEINAPLRNPAFFMRAKVMCGTVVWSDDIDIDPEYLYDESIPVEEASDA